MKKIFLTYAWLMLSMGVILTVAATYSFWQILNPILLAPPAATRPIADIQAPAPASGEIKGVESVVETNDARAEIVANFLEKHQSPMKPYDHYGQILVDIADRYGIDFRLLPAIAMQESNLCKNTNPDAPHNCLGFGIHKSGTLDFDNYEAGFDRAGRELKAYYIDRGLVTVEQIETKYTPSSHGSWASSVNQWAAEMEYDDRQKGIQQKTNANALEYAKTE